MNLCKKKKKKKQSKNKQKSKRKNVLEDMKFDFCLLVEGKLGCLVKFLSHTELDELLVEYCEILLLKMKKENTKTK